MDSTEQSREAGGARALERKSPPDREEVARLAYSYWEQRGCDHGCHEDDWFRAEEELRRGSVSSSEDDRSMMRSDASTAASPARTIIGVFHSLEQARRAFDVLAGEGFTRDGISLLANKAGTTEWTEPAVRSADEPDAAESKTTDIIDDAGMGAAVGGVGGLLLSLAGLAVPGIGPVLAAGPIIAALGGAGIGAAAGGMIGALVESGVPEEHAGHYAESVRRGGVLIAVRAAGDRADRAAELLDRAGAIDIDDRVSDWRARGWTRHEAGAPPMTADELRREREYQLAAARQGDEWRKRTEAQTARPADAVSSVSVERRPASRIYG